MEDSNDFYWNRKVYIIVGNRLIIVRKEIWQFSYVSSPLILSYTGDVQLLDLFNEAYNKFL